jgi:hypothetical protein
MIMKTNISEHTPKKMNAFSTEQKKINIFLCWEIVMGFLPQNHKLWRNLPRHPKSFFFVFILRPLYPGDGCSDFCLFFHFQFQKFFEIKNQSRCFPIRTEPSENCFSKCHVPKKLMSILW